MNNETLDHDVREAIEPDTGTVDRLVREVLRQDRPRRPVVSRVLTVGALLLLASAALFIRREPQRTPPIPVSVTNVGDTVVVRPISGGVWLIGGDAADAERLATGTILVYKSGEGR